MRTRELTSHRISEIETKIGAGLIEEVVRVAEGELLLVDEMLASRAWVYSDQCKSQCKLTVHRWEDLEEKSPPGQWEYFDRGDRV